MVVPASGSRYASAMQVGMHGVVSLVALGLLAGGAATNALAAQPAGKINNGIGLGPVVPQIAASVGIPVQPANMIVPSTIPNIPRLFAGTNSQALVSSMSGMAVASAAPIAGAPTLPAAAGLAPGLSVSQPSSIPAMASEASPHTTSNALGAPLFVNEKGQLVLAAGQSIEIADPDSPELRVVIKAPGHQALEVSKILANMKRHGIYSALAARSDTRHARGVALTADGRLKLTAQEPMFDAAIQHIEADRNSDIDSREAAPDHSSKKNSRGTGFCS